MDNNKASTNKCMCAFAIQVRELRKQNANEKVVVVMFVINVRNLR